MWTEVTIDDSDDDDMQYEEVPDVDDEDEDEEDFKATLATIKGQPLITGTGLVWVCGAPLRTLPRFPRASVALPAWIRFPRH